MSKIQTPEELCETLKELVGYKNQLEELKNKKLVIRAEQWVLLQKMKGYLADMEEELYQEQILERDARLYLKAEEVLG